MRQSSVAFLFFPSALVRRCVGKESSALNNPAGVTALQLFQIYFFFSSAAKDTVSSSPNLLQLAVFITNLQDLQKTRNYRLV